jgi:hypothetical protein
MEHHQLSSIVEEPTWPPATAYRAIFDIRLRYKRDRRPYPHASSDLAGIEPTHLQRKLRALRRRVRCRQQQGVIEVLFAKNTGGARRGPTEHRRRHAQESVMSTATPCEG